MPDDNQDDATNFRNPQSPDPMDNSPQGFGGTVNDPINQTQSVPDDVNIDPQPDLQGYQDDIATGDKTDVVQEEQGDSPADVMGRTPEELKEGLDKTAFDEQAGSNQVDDDTREQIEDLDENDKPEQFGTTA